MAHSVFEEALGSSAPEILLSIIEIVGNGFKAGDLGPGTIVGSAAYNLFCISAICVFAIKSPAVKRIEMYKVFIVTAFFGTFAYIWLLIILLFISPNVVEVWEAVVTLALFFILIWKKKKADLRQELEMSDGQRTPEQQLDADIRRYTRELSSQLDNARIVGDVPTPSMKTVCELTRNVARTYPVLSPEDQAKIIAYRMNKSLSKKSEEEQEIEKLIEQTGVVQPDGRIKPIVEFSARVYAVDRGDKQVKLTIVRRGPVKNAIKVNYTTVNGIAKKDEHFLFKSESLHFGPNETKRDVYIDLNEGADWRPNHVFYVHLKIEEQEDGDKTKLGDCSIARVRYPDLDASISGQPNVEFAKDNYVAKESIGWTRVYVTKRGKRSAADVTISYETQDGTAQENFDYVPVRDGRLMFYGQEYEKYIDIEILDDKADEKDETFTIEITKIHDHTFTFGVKRKTIVTIVSDDNMLKNVTNVRKLLGHYLKKMTPGQQTWKEQILNAVSVNAGDIANATLGDCLTHALAFPWKFAFAFIPPPSLLNGYPCFIIALVAIGLITAVVGKEISLKVEI
ncbi:hypothetical protein WR25_06418 isoform A [Diploscapter pachys]|uniref:Calx-beta domain-containing protein n=1 Tax=Diploscapter pachys TaxID=2018661 RepID=A0A2A2K8Y4_9BILA|nr:hypothetical protein WR25_06418 isoform A [Diploscapter pachys]